MIVVLWIVVGLLVVGFVAAWALLVQFAAQQGRLLMRLETLEARMPAHEDDGVCGGTLEAAPEALALGAEFPPFDLRDLDGKPVGLADFRGRRVLLVNWSPTCGFCEAIAPTLRKLHDGMRKHDVELLLVASGDADSNRRLARAHRLECPILLAERPVDGFGAIGTPAAYLLDEEAHVASARALGAQEVPELARQAAGSKARVLRLRSTSESRIRRDGLPPGTPAPDFKLRRINGEGTVSLGQYRGERVLLVFSHPQCAPCDELAPRLAELHRRFGDRLRMVMIGRGDEQENLRKCEDHGIEFPYVVQRGSKLSREYGIFAWPVAFLVGEDGAIEQRLTTGATAILAAAERIAGAEEDVPMNV